MNHSPIRYIGNEVANTDYHHGQLRPVVGASHYQVLRANRYNYDDVDGFGWTYNHAPMLAYWNGMFYLEYLSNPISEHVPPGHTMITRSYDGIHWEKPVEVFPVYDIPVGNALPQGLQACMHQRMGFYVSPNEKLLVLGFYGICANNRPPNDGNGIGRVVREIRKDNTLGPIYFLRYNRHAGWNESNTNFPFYKSSDDLSFIEACEYLLLDKLITLQWWEEDRSKDGFYAIEGGKALSFYHLPDGRVIGLWKGSMIAISEDEGKTWSNMWHEPSFIMAGAKVWGQRTPDGRYAMIYNPTPDNSRRWPLAIVTSDDGLIYDNLGLINGRVSPRRYMGQYKDFGQNYVRGIVEGNGTPPGDAFWITYSMNKEDIWVSRIPTPIRLSVDDPVHDTFNDMPTDGLVRDWNIFSGKWTKVSVVEFPSKTDKSLCLTDEDPYEYAEAQRIFPESRKATVAFRLLVLQNNLAPLVVEVVGAKGTAPCQITFSTEGQIEALTGHGRLRCGSFELNRWYDIEISIDANIQRYSLSVNGRELFSSRPFCRPMLSVERIIFRTGLVPDLPRIETQINDIPDQDKTGLKTEKNVFYINSLDVECTSIIEDKLYYKT